MKVEQAFYGAVRSGHSILSASDGAAIAADLSARLDLPDTAPPGVLWSPFLRGFPTAGHYVLARTFLDPEAKRSGMVFSHALIAPLDDFAATRDLRPFLDLLSRSPQVPHKVAAVEIADSETEISPTRELTDAASQLVSRGNGPVVRIGVEGFDQLVVALWAGLWPQLRRGFAFRLSFSPHDLTEAPMPAIVCTPASLSSRWTEYRLIGHSGTSDRSSMAASALLGRPEGSELLDFGQQFGIEVGTFSELALLEQTHALLSNVGASFDSLVPALRLVERLSKDATIGEAQKSTLISKLNDLMKNASASQILHLRNLSLSRFTQANTLWSSMRQWVATNLYKSDDDGAFLAIVDDATKKASAVMDWQTNILNGFSDAALLPQSAFPNAFWRWEQRDPTVAERLVDYLPNDKDFELRLAVAAPRGLAAEIAQPVLNLSTIRGWLVLHAGVAAAAYEPGEAIALQLGVDSDLQNISGIRLVLRYASTRQVISCALSSPDPRLLQIAAETVALAPQSISDFDVSIHRVQTIWANALQKNKEAWNAYSDSQATFWRLLTMLLGGVGIDQNLILELSVSPLSDLSDFPRRTEVWDVLPPQSKQNFLRRTSLGWLERADKRRQLYSPEVIIQEYLIAGSELYTQLNAFIPDRIGDAVQLISLLNLFPEMRFRSWFSAVMMRVQRMNEVDVESVGFLVLARQWTHVLDRLVELFQSGRQDLKAALRICHDLLGAWTRFRLRIVPISSGEKWQLLSETCAQLYSQGPDQDDLWQRAGGNNSELYHFGTGRDRWSDALLKIRQGHRVRPWRLFAVMRQDYPANEELRYLSDDPEFAEPRRP